MQEHSSMPASTSGHSGGHSEADVPSAETGHISRVGPRPRAPERKSPASQLLWLSIAALLVLVIAYVVSMPNRDELPPEPLQHGQLLAQ